MNKIYVACFKYYDTGNDVIGYALCEDGHGLVSHVSSSIEWSKHDMGFLNSTWHHDTYKEHCPEGFELIWIDDADNDERWLDAVKLNEQLEGQEKTL